MAAPRNRRHIVVSGRPTVEAYKPHGRRFDKTDHAPSIGRAKHGEALKRSFEAAMTEASSRRDEAGIKVHGAVPGIYVQFESLPAVPLQVESLEDLKQGIEVVACTSTSADEQDPRRVEQATVFVPEGKVKHFLSRFEAYSNAATKKRGERRHEKMIDPIATLRLATLRGLWTDATGAYPADDEVIWWEVWLRRQDGNELARLMEFAGAKGIEISPRRIIFDDRVVVLVKGASGQLAVSIDVLNDIAEVRKAKVTAASFVDMGPKEQGDLVLELRDRVSVSKPDAPVVCVLDTGVTRGHPLLEGSIDAADCHTCDPAWGVHDHHGHGTEMAGLALYGDLAPLLAGTQQVVLRHQLESVKILPPRGHGPNPPELYGAITAEAVSRAETQAPQRRRTISMSVSATDTRDRGQPTSWSAAIDALAAGRSFDATTKELCYLDGGLEAARRLFVLSAGNVAETSLTVDHVDYSDTDPIHDPGQAWNALTVGALTEKAVINDPELTSWQPVARPGELSPWSTTGVTFASQWPIKPDVVFEGGNVIKNAKGMVSFPCEDLSLLSTHFKPADKSFVLSWATSAAAAQAARLACLIAVEYPGFWPETVRALVVHSAEWTAHMRSQLISETRKRARAKLVQRYGFGVPSVERALRSANNAVTLVSQGSIRPFAEGKMREVQYFSLPWPSEVLAGLGSIQAKLRVTLSYFVEPNPGRRGWRMRHRYASHGLRFDVKKPTDSLDDFRKRINSRALEENERRPDSGGDSARWLLGETARNRGSLHADILECSAADLAERGVLAVYPVSGWWKDQPKRDRSAKGARYSLVVSIETPGVDADIWTPVAIQVGVPVVVES